MYAQQKNVNVQYSFGMDKKTAFFIKPVWIQDQLRS